jgi:hypothetical protein
MKFELFRRASRLHIALATASVFLSTSIFAVLASNQFQGAAYTTNQSGTRVNENLYQRPDDVYINGGPNNPTSQGLPANEVFYFEVTDPSGKTPLSTDPAICRQVQTDVNGRISGPYAVDGCVHPVGTIDTTNGSVPVKLWPFDRTPNSGGEYKVVLVRKDAPGVSVESDGIHLDYPRAATKSDNFKVMSYVAPTPTPTPSPSPTPGGGGNDT